MNLPAALINLLPFAPPLLLALGACFAKPAFGRMRFWLNSAALGAAFASAVHVIGSSAGPSWQDGGLASPAAASHLMAVLITFLGLVIAQFSKNYLAGETRAQHFTMVLQLTLAAVAVVVLTDNLLVLFGGWVGISLSLHQLLLFYPERPRAALAAHKKFLFARSAEVALLVAVLILATVHGSWQISEIVAAYANGAIPGTAEQLAALLLVSAALIKCAQLPVHGWLIQVVEAPTPVSALLHAGIINLGGYLLILFAPLLGAVEAAQWLLLVVAGLTTVLASLIMTTRISVKVKLAWSTVAQMGLMLIECALGLYELALLHLLAHGCYKAYLFLNAGTAVEQHLERQLAPAAQTPVGAWFAAAALVVPLTVIAALLFAPGGPFSPWLLVAAFLTMVFAERNSLARPGAPTTAMALVLVLLVAFVTQKAALGGALPNVATSANLFADLWVALLIALLCGGWALLQRRPTNPIALRLRAWLYAGLFLDEWVSRMTLKLWPPRLPVRVNPKRLAELREEVE